MYDLNLKTIWWTTFTVHLATHRVDSKSWTFNSSMQTRWKPDVCCKVWENKSYRPKIMSLSFYQFIKTSSVKHLKYEKQVQTLSKDIEQIYHFWYTIEVQGYFVQQTTNRQHNRYFLQQTLNLSQSPCLLCSQVKNLVKVKVNSGYFLPQVLHKIYLNLI